jgi:hypothetical protein
VSLEYEEKMLSFHYFIIHCWKRTNIEIGQKGNMDGTPVTFGIPLNRTIASKGEKTVKTTGHEEAHYTVVLACYADSTELSLILIFKRKTGPKDKIQAGVIVHVHKKRMDG